MADSTAQQRAAMLADQKVDLSESMTERYLAAQKADLLVLTKVEH